MELFGAVAENNVNYQYGIMKYTSLYLACSEGNLNIVKLLLNNERININ